MKTFPYWRTAGQAMRWARIQGNAQVTRHAFDDHANAGEDPALDHHWRSGDYRVAIARHLDTGRTVLKVTHCGETKICGFHLDAGQMLNALVGMGLLPDCFYVPTLPPGAYPSIEVPAELRSVFVAAVKAARHVQDLEIRRLHRQVQHLSNERDRARQATAQLAGKLLDQALERIPLASGPTKNVQAYAQGGVVQGGPGLIGHTCVGLCCDCPPSQLGWPTRHLFGDESAVSECCGRTRLEMPSGDWFTSNPDMITCQGKPAADEPEAGRG